MNNVGGDLTMRAEFGRLDLKDKGMYLVASQNSRTKSLTGRQRDCLKWVAQGKSSTDIASILEISRNTVDEHLANACDRLGVRTRLQAALIASRLGLIDDDEN